MRLHLGCACTNPFQHFALGLTSERRNARRAISGLPMPPPPPTPAIVGDQTDADQRSECATRPSTHNGLRYIEPLMQSHVSSGQKMKKIQYFELPPRDQ